MFALLFLLAVGPAPATVPVQAQARVDYVALFESGAAWRPWFDSIRTQQATWRQVAGQANPPQALVDRLKAVGGNLRLLVVAEPNCSDSMQSLPHIAALAERAGVPLRIISKDAGTAAIDQRRTPDGRMATPTVILIRDNADVAAWIERPAALQAWFLANANLSRAELLQRKTAWYQWDRGASTLEEIVALATANERTPWP
jgi:hypothetical protein